MFDLQPNTVIGFSDDAGDTDFDKIINRIVQYSVGYRKLLFDIWLVTEYIRLNNTFI